MLLPCYLKLLGAAAGERDCGDESADGAVTMLFGAVGGLLRSKTAETNLRTVLLPCYLELLGKRDCRDESAGRCCYHAIWSFCWGVRRQRTICGRCLQCDLELFGGCCWGARLRR